MANRSENQNELSVFDRQFELLKLELELVNNAIRQHDEITKSIKNWAIVTWTASMGAGLATSAFHDFIWLVAFIPLVFWAVDGLYRRIQRMFIQRTEKIADYLNSNDFRREAMNGQPISLELMELAVRHGTGWEWYKQYLKVLRFHSVWGLYVGLVGITLAVWIMLSVTETAVPK